MANILAAQNGNWSSTSTWIGGVIPNATDFVYTNNKIVTVDTDIYCLKLSNKAENGSAVGGSLTVNSNYNLNIGTLDTGATTLVNLSSNCSPTFIGNINGSTALVGRGIDNLGTGTLTVSGTVNGGSVAWSSGTNLAEGIRNSSTGSIVVYGSLMGGASAVTCAVHNFGNGNVTVNGNLSGHPISTGQALRVNGGGNITINGDLYGLNGYALVTLNTAGTTNTITIRGNSHAPINNNGTGYAFSIASFNSTTNIYGNIYGSQGTSTATTTYGGSITQSSGIVNVYGNIYGATSDGNSSVGLYVLGGTFASPINFNFTGNLYGGCSRWGTANYQAKHALRIGLANANLTCGEILGGLNSLANVRTVASNSYGLLIEGAGTVVTATVPELKNTNNWSSPNIYINNLQATLNLITGGIYDDINSNQNNVASCVIGNNAGTINITGNGYGKDFGVSGSTYDTIRGNIAIGQFSSNSTINVAGNLVGGICGVALYNSGGTTTATKIIGNRHGITTYANSQPTGFAWYGVTGTSKLIVEEIESGLQGNFPAMGNIYLKSTNNSKLIFKTPESNSLARTFTDPLSSNAFPLSSDVRFGISYAGGNLTGSCCVPSASSVSYGVPIDNTVGIAVLDATTLWSFNAENLPSTGIGGRLKNCATVEAVGAQIAAFLP
jgi:hypothetical protein